MKSKNNKHSLLETDLLHNIKSLKEELIQTGMSQGLDHEKTIHISQKLDQYIFQYQSFYKNNSQFLRY